MKKDNDMFQKIGQKLTEADSILIYPHVNMDGDALGSAAAVCRTLRNMGKTCWILIEDDIPRNLQFLDRGYCTRDQQIVGSPDISLCLDCGETSRFPGRKDKFLEGRTTICIDHHRTTVPFCDYNYVDFDAAATGQLIYYLLREMGTEIDGEIADAIFAAITTDTGNFRYSNTTKECHEIMAALYDLGVDVRRVCQQVYESYRLQQILLHGRALGQLSVFGGGKVAMTVVTQEMLRETGASMDETEGIVDKLRSIDGVEIAALVKEDEPEKIKFSLRAKSAGNVAAIAKNLGGGGHTKAAGGTMKMTLDEALPLIRQEVEKALL